MALPTLAPGIDTAVHIHHGGVALVDILGSKVEHVVVKPNCTESFLPVARYLNPPVGIAAFLGGAPSAGIDVVVDSATGVETRIFCEFVGVAARISRGVIEWRRVANADFFSRGFITWCRRPFLESLRVVGRIARQRVMSRENHRPVVVVVLAGEKKRLREAIALGRVVSIVVVSCDEVISESPVRLELDGQCVVVAE